MKRIYSAAAGILCAAVISVPAYAKDSAQISADAAKEAAWQAVPRSCSYLTTDTERYLYEVKYFDKTNQEKYVVQVGRSGGGILELTVQSADRKGGSEVRISAEDAKQAVQALYADAVNLTAELEERDGAYAYTVRCKTPFTDGTARVDAETGRILERDDVYFQAKDEELGDIVKSATSDTLARQAVSEELVRMSALAEVPGGTIDRLRLTGGRRIYEVKLHKGDYEYDLLYNASTGARLNISSSYDPADFTSDWYQNPGTVEKASPRFGMAQIQKPSAVKSSGTEGAYISRDKAKQIAMRSAPSGAKLKSMSLKHSGGETYYEGWLRQDGMLYGFQIDAESGSVINWDTKIDESWDPEEHHDVDAEKERDEDIDYGGLRLDDID